ncbi:MAG: hypothetical protein JST44_20815 [Cyanobacteria bacterium SZAS LIN-5]|nr:hypothetical protein [Cyanobacteria bacterium SZAS LIN-5]RTL34907.1 MAG: hypothetical protein EKK48_30480 [Candidatus Melainabacteria bacterium]
MKTPSLRLLLIALTVLTCTSGVNSWALPAPGVKQTAPQNTAKMNALQLKQSHYFFGDVETIASKTAIRMEDTGSWKFVLVARAPDWKVTVYRNDDKIYYTCPLETFLDGGMVSQFLVGRKGEFINGGSNETLSTTVAGVHVKRCRGSIALCEYLPAEKLVAPQVVRILYETFRMPTNGGVTLRFMQIKQGTDWMTGLKDSGLQKMLSTQSAKMVSVPVSIFDPPTGYKRSKSLREVLISKESRDSSTDAKDLFEIK